MDKRTDITTTTTMSCALKGMRWVDDYYNKMIVGCDDAMFEVCCECHRCICHQHCYTTRITIDGEKITMCDECVSMLTPVLPYVRNQSTIHSALKTIYGNGSMTKAARQIN
tara:strand:- start:1040 stop:1372 length:333 start_codon:yes stop_codon:yes gene_type:complete